MLLQEADKSRFVKKAVKAAQEDPYVELSQEKADYYIEELTKFANSGAADRYKINWQRKPIELYSELVDAYEEYQDKGGSISNRKAQNRKDPKNLFKNSDYKVVQEGQDPTGADLIQLNSLETDKYLFYVPLTWGVCKWLDDWSCGGYGAKWCLGYKNDIHWREHVYDKGELFVFVFNKEEYLHPSGEEDKLKYMIELNKTRRNMTQAWLQSDLPNQTIWPKDFKSVFGHDANDLIVAAQQAVFVDGAKTEYSHSPFAKLVVKNGKIVPDDVADSDKAVLSLWQLYHKNEEEIRIYLEGLFENAYDEGFDSLTVDGSNVFWGLASDESLSGLNSNLDLFDASRFLSLIQKHDKHGITKTVVFSNIHFDTLRLFTDNDYVDHLDIKHNASINIDKIKFDKCTVHSLQMSEAFFLAHKKDLVLDFDTQSKPDDAIELYYFSDPAKFADDIYDDAGCLRQISYYTDMMVFKEPDSDEIEDGETFEDYQDVLKQRDSEPSLHEAADVFSRGDFAAFEEDNENLNDDWADLADTFCDIVGDDHYDDIASTPVRWREGLIRGRDGVMLGSTRLTPFGLTVLISTAADEDNDTYFNALFHEMCHVWAYYEYNDLDKDHTKGWKEAADLINKHIKGKKLAPIS